MLERIAPKGEHGFRSWMRTFLIVLKTKADDLDFDLARVHALADTFDEYEKACFDQKFSMGDAKMTRQRKSWLKYALTRDLEEIYDLLIDHPAMTYRLRNALGLKAKWRVRPEWQIASLQPIAHAEAGDGRVLVHFSLSTKYRGRNQLPDGVTMAGISRKKAGERRFRQIAQVRESPYVDSLADHGADYVYMVCFYGPRKGERSKCSEPVTVSTCMKLAA